MNAQGYITLLPRGTKVAFTYTGRDKRTGLVKTAKRVGYVDSGPEDKVLRVLPEETPEGFRSFNLTGIKDLVTM